MEFRAIQFGAVFVLVERSGKDIFHRSIWSSRPLAQAAVRTLGGKEGEQLLISHVDLVGTVGNPEVVPGQRAFVVLQTHQQYGGKKEKLEAILTNQDDAKDMEQSLRIEFGRRANIRIVAAVVDQEDGVIQGYVLS